LKLSLIPTASQKFIASSPHSNNTFAKSNALVARCTSDIFEFRRDRCQHALAQHVFPAAGGVHDQPSTLRYTVAHLVNRHLLAENQVHLLTTAGLAMKSTFSRMSEMALASTRLVTTRSSNAVSSLHQKGYSTPGLIHAVSTNPLLPSCQRRSTRCSRGIVTPPCATYIWTSTVMPSISLPRISRLAAGLTEAGRSKN
jgi:hypothetical protein